MNKSDSTTVRAEPSAPVGSNGPVVPPQDVQALVAAPKRRHPWVLLASMVLVVIIAATTISFFVVGPSRESTNDAYVESRVVRISPKVSGQVISLRVDDNDTVKAGDLLLEIDPVDYQAKVDQATAAVAASESAVEQSKATVLRAEAKRRRSAGGGAGGGDRSDTPRQRLSPVRGDGH